MIPRFQRPSPELIERLKAMSAPRALLLLELMTLRAFARARRDALCLLPHLAEVSGVMRISVNPSALLSDLASLVERQAPPTTAEELVANHLARGAEDDPRSWTLPHVDELVRALSRLVPDAFSRGRHARYTTSPLSSRVGTLEVSPHVFLNLSDEERLYLYAHEALHLYLRHPWRGEELEEDVWQLAADHEVNVTLSAISAITMPPGALIFHKLRGRSAEVVYLHLLKKGRRRRPRSNGWGAPRESRVEEGRVTPTHDWSPDDLTRLEELNPNVLDWHGDPGGESARIEELLKQIQQLLINEPGVTPKPKEAPSKPPSSDPGASELERQLCHLRDQAIARGVIPWRALLARFNHARAHAYSPSRHRRRLIHRDLYLPSYRGDAIRLAVALDTSGSTLGLLPTFLKELEEVLRACPRFDLTLIQCAAAVHKTDRFTHRQRAQIGATEVVGGGGTRFGPVFEHLARDGERAPDLLLYFTDGVGPRVEAAPSYPVLWVLCGEHERPASFGVELRLSQEDARVQGAS
ncbi:MAG: hypothetical protein FJ138_02305 [Deltaproteobacteria bacterium]|nr:hypothetical protein [Deltaproteobacteria bacterium]